MEYDWKPRLLENYIVDENINLDDCLQLFSIKENSENWNEWFFLKGVKIKWMP